MKFYEPQRDRVRKRSESAGTGEQSTRARHSAELVRLTAAGGLLARGFR